MMKKITDERLQLQNLKNIRVLFLIQTVGIIAILAYDLVTKGMEGMTGNPLWFVLLITGVASAYLSMSISIDHESSEKSPKKGLIISLFVNVIVAIGFGILISLTGDLATGALIGGIVFVCCLAPSLYIYYLRMKRQN